MTQQKMYFRPPSEAESFLLRVMHGCPHNKCTFCNTFLDVPLRRVPLPEVLAGIDADTKNLGPDMLAKIHSIYLEGGDPLSLPAEHLLAIMGHARRRFPSVDRFACYATARFGIQKKPEELENLARAGLRRVYVGLESGCDDILRAVNKGCSRADLLRAGQMLAQAGIELDVSMMLGIGGPQHSVRHALETSSLLNAIRPVAVRILTFVPKADTPLLEDCIKGRFMLMGPHEILRELRLMLKNITAEMHLVCNHWSNFLPFEADMPRGREALMAYIDMNLTRPVSDFRELGMSDDKS